jgi:hypothetical protein
MKALFLLFAIATSFEAKADYIQCEYNHPASQMFLDMGSFFIYHKHPGQPTGPMLSPGNHCLNGDRGEVERTGANPTETFRVDYKMNFLQAPNDAWTSYARFARNDDTARLSCWGPRIPQIEIPFTNCKSMKGAIPK